MSSLSSDRGADAAEKGSAVGAVPSVTVFLCTVELLVGKRRTVEEAEKEAEHAMAGEGEGEDEDEE